MAASAKQPARKTGLSLYANLLDSSNASSDSAIISKAPVVFSQAGGEDGAEEASDRKHINAAALRFQPTKRPQLAAQKGKAKAPAVPKIASGASEATSSETKAVKPAVQPNVLKTTLADWTATEDDLPSLYENTRQRAGRKKRRKNKEQDVHVQNWDDIYDPSRPNVYEEYKHSDERLREIRDWKDRLYAGRRARQMRRGSDQSSDDGKIYKLAKAFPPPSGMSFAPPKFEEAAETAPDLPAAEVAAHQHASGEDAYTRRLRMSQAPPPLQRQQEQSQVQSLPIPVPLSQTAPPPPPASYVPPPPPPSERSVGGPLLDASQPAPPADPSSLSFPPSLQHPALPTSGVIVSRAPVRYNLPVAPAEIEVSQETFDAATKARNESADVEVEVEAAGEEAPRSSRPGQRGFAARYMANQGWKKGEGLGASGSGIVDALRVQVEKRKKRSDADGGGFVGPGGKGKIVGGKKKPGTEEDGKFGKMNEVIVARGMLTGMDVDAEIENGLLQELGEECEAKYGRLVRIYINRNSTEATPPVYFHFTSALSALRAVNALDGRVFNGNSIEARFYDVEKFEKDIYE